MNDTFGGGLIIRNRDDLVLLVKGTSGKWSFPKGGTEPCDTDFLSTAIRECFEEIGLMAGIDYYLLNDAPFTCLDRTYYFARMYDISNEYIKLKEKEIIDYRWHNPIDSCHYWKDLNIGVRRYMKMMQH